MNTRKSPTESATLYKIGTKKKGNDNNIWIITENKNGVKRWKLYKKKQEKTQVIKEGTVSKEQKLVPLPSFYEMYDMPRLEITKKNIETWGKSLTSEQFSTLEYFLSTIIPELKKLGIQFFLVPLGQNRSTGYYFIDAVPKIIEDLYNCTQDDYASKDVMEAVLNINTENRLSDNYIYIYHSKISNKLKEKIVLLMKQKFSKHYYWNGNNKNAIRITL